MAYVMHLSKDEALEIVKAFTVSTPDMTQEELEKTYFWKFICMVVCNFRGLNWRPEYRALVQGL